MPRLARPLRARPERDVFVHAVRPRARGAAGARCGSPARPLGASASSSRVVVAAPLASLPRARLSTGSCARASWGGPW